MHCARCGRKLPGQGAFCPGCGSPVPSPDEKLAGENTPRMVERRERRKLIGCVTAVFVGLFLAMVAARASGAGVLGGILGFLWVIAGFTLLDILREEK